MTGYLRVQGATDPDDLASEVFLGVFRNLHRFEGDEAAFRSWVFTIAHRRIIDDRRRRGRRPRTVPLDDVDVSHEETFEDEVAARADLERLKPVIDRLPKDQRDALLLRVLGDLDHEEAAEAMGKRPGTVRVLQHRALKRLRQELSEEL
ncbi:MAG: sigma-70 family RNA polymerase sigma factor [Actinobacteria bacterium]|nr:sigma-70 family RNA polymerase sigma factor [Actinomycetota bacterium]